MPVVGLKELILLEKSKILKDPPTNINEDVIDLLCHRAIIALPSEAARLASLEWSVSRGGGGAQVEHRVEPGTEQIFLKVTHIGRAQCRKGASNSQESYAHQPEYPNIMQSARYDCN